MKAERRHELQENSLAHILTNFPVYASVYGPRILLALALVVLVVVVVRYRAAVQRQAAADACAGLATARDAIAQISQLGSGFLNSADVAQRRALLFNEAGSQLDVAAANAATDTIKAEAAVARGDLYWTLANLPDLPGAATQPALALPERRDALLSKAEAAYQSVIEQFPRETASKVTAVLGLGAIAENRRDFDAARKQYEQLAAAEVPSVYRTLAEQRLAYLPMLATPRRIVPATTRPAALGAGDPAPAVTPFISLDQPIESIRPTTLPATFPAGG